MRINNTTSKIRLGFKSPLKRINPKDKKIKAMAMTKIENADLINLSKK